MFSRFFSKTHAELKIFFQDLNYEIIEDVPKYSVQSLLGKREYGYDMHILEYFRLLFNIIYTTDSLCIIH